MFSDMLFTAVCPLKDLQRFVVFKIISIFCTVLSFDYGKRIADDFEDFIKKTKVSAPDTFSSSFSLEDAAFVSSFAACSSALLACHVFQVYKDAPEARRKSVGLHPPLQPRFFLLSLHEKRQSVMTVFLPENRKSSELFSLTKTNSLFYCLCH